MQETQKNFGQGSITIDVPTETFNQESFNTHFAGVNHNGEDD